MPQTTGEKPYRKRVKRPSGEHSSAICRNRRSSPASELQLRTKQRMQARCYLGAGDADYDRFDLVIGMPVLPYKVPPPAMHGARHLWEDWSSLAVGRTAVTYTDGSGFDPSIPELTRCGWAIV